MLPLRPTQHHGIRVGVHPDPISDLSAFTHPHDTVRALGVGAPHGPLNIEADAVGPDGRRQLRPDAPVAESAILLNVEGGQTMAQCLADD